MDTLNPDQSRPDTRNSAENESELVSNLADDGLASIVGGNNNEVDGSELGTNASAKAGKKNDSSALTKVLNVDMISKGISLLARTGNGLSMAYTKLDLHDKGLSAIDVLEQYPHLRYVVQSHERH